MGLVASVAACGSDDTPGSNANDTNVASVQGAIGVLDWPSLPICTVLNRGVVYYVKSSAKLAYCDGTKFQELAFTGPAGPAGANGANGHDGTSYLVTVTAASLTTCPTGGVVIQVGPDANHDGTLDSVTATAAVCNGAQGPKGDTGAKGLTSLVDVTAEPAGSNCVNGGQRIDVGVDTNADGVLEPSEITKTKYVCNGSSGPGVVCSVGNTLYPIGASAPGNVCQACTPSSSATAFTNVADGTACATNSVCKSGGCELGCTIGGTFYPHKAIDPGNVCLQCDASIDGTSWSATQGGVSCGAGRVCGLLGTCDVPCAPPVLTNASFAQVDAGNVPFGWMLWGTPPQVTSPFLVNGAAVTGATNSVLLAANGNAGQISQSFTICDHPSYKSLTFAVVGAIPRKLSRRSRSETRTWQRTTSGSPRRQPC